MISPLFYPSLINNKSLQSKDLTCSVLQQNKGYQHRISRGRVSVGIVRNILTKFCYKIYTRQLDLLLLIYEQETTNVIKYKVQV